MDAELLASSIADTLISVSGGVIARQDRDAVREQFRGYFDGAEYGAWDDIEPPVVQLSPDGSRAVVHRTVRVDRREPGMGREWSRRQFESAWTATYAWAEGGWRMTSVTSTFPALRSLADEVLSAVRRRLRVEEALAGSVLRAPARAAGPDGDFEVVVHSSSDGLARIDFDSGFSLAAHVGSGWARSGEEPATPLTPDLLAFLRGHEIHLLLLAPESRLEGLRYVGRTTFEETPVIWLRGADALGGDVDLYYSLPDTIPLGLETEDHVRLGPRVTVTTSDWSPLPDGTVLATAATFRQASQVFEYRYESLEWLPREEVLFREGSH